MKKEIKEDNEQLTKLKRILPGEDQFWEDIEYQNNKAQMNVEKELKEMEINHNEKARHLAMPKKEKSKNEISSFTQTLYPNSFSITRKRNRKRKRPRRTRTKGEKSVQGKRDEETMAEKRRALKETPVQGRRQNAGQGTQLAQTRTIAEGITRTRRKKTNRRTRKGRGKAIRQKIRKKLLSQKGIFREKLPQEIRPAEGLQKKRRKERRPAKIRRLQKTIRTKEKIKTKKDNEKTKNCCVVNLSSFALSDIEINLLNRGLKFVPTPAKPNKARLLTDLKTFIRKVRIGYFWAIRKNAKSKRKHPLAPKSTWIPPKATNMKLERTITRLERTIKHLRPKTPKNNVTKEERRALKSLANNKNIIIRKADKGAAIIVENVNDYITKGLEHLNDENTYKRLDKDPTQALVKSINSTVESLANQGVIDAETTTFLLKNPEEVRPQLMYFLKKIHKNPMGVRPICSASAGPTEGLSKIVDTILQPIVPTLPSFVKDSGHFCKIIEETLIPDDAILVALDVKSLYPSIPQEDAISACKEATEKFYKNDNDAPVIVETFLNFILKGNVFTFNGQTYLQKHGTAMGTKTAPCLANIFMGDFEQKFMATQAKKPHLWKRYIDDIFMVWTHTEEELTTFLLALNYFSTSIKFTHEISHTESTFLDTTVYKGPKYEEFNILDIKTYFKPTNKFAYLNYNSCHPNHCKTAIINGELNRFLRTTSNEEEYEALKQKHIERLKNREYPERLLQKETEKMPFTKRPEIISRITGKTRNQLNNKKKKIPFTFVTTFDPWLQHFKKGIRECWKDVEKDPILSNLFPEPIVFAYKNEKSLNSKLVRAKLPNQPQPVIEKDTAPISPILPNVERRITPCRFINCKSCHVLTTSNTLKSHSTGIIYPIKQKMNCKSENVIYVLTCKHCQLQYVGQTSKMIQERITRHRNDSKTKDYKIYEHMKENKLTFEDNIIVTPLQQVEKEDLVTTETYWIKTLKTLHPKGFNTKFEKSSDKT